MKRRLKRMLEMQISELPEDRNVYIKSDIEKQIKYTYWMGGMNKRQYDYYNKMLSDKYTEVMNKHQKKVDASYEEDYQNLLRKCGINNS